MGCKLNLGSRDCKFGYQIAQSYCGRGSHELLLTLHLIDGHSTGLMEPQLFLNNGTNVFLILMKIIIDIIENNTIIIIIEL